MSRQPSKRTSSLCRHPRSAPMAVRHVLALRSYIRLSGLRLSTVRRTSMRAGLGRWRTGNGVPADGRRPPWGSIRERPRLWGSACRAAPGRMSGSAWASCLVPQPPIEAPTASKETNTPRPATSTVVPIRRRGTWWASRRGADGAGGQLGGAPVEPGGLGCEARPGVVRLRGDGGGGHGGTGGSCGVGRRSTTQPISPSCRDLGPHDHHRSGTVRPVT